MNLHGIVLLAVALRNLRRRPFSSLAVFFSVAVLAAALFFITAVVISVQAGLVKGTGRLGADIMVVSHEAEPQTGVTLIAGNPTSFYLDMDVEEMTSKVIGVRKVSGQVYLKTLRLGCCTVGDVLVVGIDPKTDFTITPWLEERLKTPLKEDEVVIGGELIALIIEARASPEEVEDSLINLFGKPFRIVGILEPTGMKFMDNSVFLTAGALKELPRAQADGRDDHTQVPELPLDKTSSIMVQVEPGAEPEVVAGRIEYENPDVRAIVSEQVSRSVRGRLFVVYESVIYVGVILWVMAAVMTGLVFSVSVNERRTEIGLLRAMGARKRDVFSIIITEAAMICFAGGLAGIWFGGLFFYLRSEHAVSTMGLPFYGLSGGELLMLAGGCLLISFVTGICSALIPALSAMRMDPFNCIKK